MCGLHHLLLLLLLLASNTNLLLLTLAEGGQGNSSCRIEQFTCSDGGCIAGYRECDNYTDCSDGSDEHKLCGSSVCVNRSRCDNGRCIPRTSFCDLFDDCGDGSDEKTGCIKLYTCTNKEYQCPLSGKCISSKFVCDGEDDCGGGEDEANCTQVHRSCYENEFQCNNLRCIRMNERCNQVNNCGDNSDELNCDASLCNSSQFDCGNGECISLEYRCDGFLDCPIAYTCDDKRTCALSSLDEAKCSGCHDSFQCTNGKCVTNSSRCNAFDNCGDNSDELNCSSFTCSEEYFLCNDTHPRCIREDRRCDGNMDCNNGSDERDCSITCPNDHFLCNDTHQRCIVGRRRCDGIIDCRDGSDEQDCWTECPVGFGYMRCLYNNACIEYDLICDGTNDCIDGSDEVNCSNMCSSSEFECHSGEKCIATEKRCDDIYDCFDFSDENNCSISVANCSTQQFDCGPGTVPRCISQAWVCDGQVDCENGVDEVSSNTSSCELQECNKETHFECVNHSKCIKIQFLCDGFPDCIDGSDEGLFCNSSSCKNTSCSHECSLTPFGPRCYCQPGYQLTSDKIHCEDYNECSSVNRCQQSCVNTEGGYECQCTEGYFANMETSTCMAEGSDPLLMFTNRHDVITYNLRNLTEDSVLLETHKPTSLAFHYRKSLIFYTDLDRQRIYKFDPNNSTLIPVVSHDLASPASIDVDWINDKMYWTDYSAGRIESADLNGNNRVTIVSRNNTEFKPFYLAVDPHKRIIFWSTDGSIKAIQVSSMDGSDVRTVVDSNIATVSGLTLDRIQERIYWIDYVMKSIETCSYNGMNRFTLFRNDRLIQSPFSLTLFEDHLYWVDTKLFALRAMERHNSSHPKTVVGTLRTPRSVIVYQKQMQPDGINYCAQHNCSHNCMLSSNSSLNYSCVCPDGLHLHVDKTTCVPTEHYQKPIHPACQLSKTFQCANKNCIHNSFVCNGKDDCGDGSDEIDNCTSAICEEGTFFCPGHTTLCANDSVICDGKVNCVDGRDEPIICRRTCRKDEFTCKNLLCIKASYACDGTPDCWDSSDETETLCANQTCQPNEFRCTNHGCISNRWVCDGLADCNDASDERNCDTIPCKANEFTCGSTGVKYCIPQAWTCDGQDDCGNGNDERAEICPNTTTCLNNQFTCSNGECIKQQFICDGDDDCGDNSDEQVNCSLLPCEGSAVRCNNTGACLPFWKGCNGVDDCGDKSDETDCKPGSSSSSCADDEFQCHTLHCIPMAAHCNGIIDCMDHSDEDNCGYSPCIDGTFHCKISNSCINATLVCDGDFDCSDHSDEEQCGIKPQCPESHFTCFSNNRCIDNYLVCDEKRDCERGEDEISCGINECDIPNVHQCSHICEDHVSSYKCRCPAGMRLGSDEKNCEDINECIEVFGVCDQTCTNVKGSYRCECRHGFTLEPDGHTCKLNEEANLYVATGRLITRKSPDTASYDKAVLASSDNTIRAIAVHQNDLFYAPVHGYIKKHKDALHSSLSFNTDTVNFIAIDTVLDMAVDWVGHKLYWTGGNSTIYCSDTEHPLVTMVADARSGLGTLGEIAVHPKSSSMFIVNHYRHSLDAHIERWSLNGQFLQTVVSNKITNPNSVVVDSIIDRIYWSDSVYKYIHTARLDGTDRKSIVSGLAPTISSIAIFQNRVYFTVYHQIFHKDRFRTDGVATLANHNSGFVHDLIFNSTAMQPYSNDPCQNSTCEYSCLPSYNGISSCACPPQSSLQEDNITCTGVTSCPTGSKLCNMTGLCLPTNSLCNRYIDCPDGSDESNCAAMDSLPCVDYCSGQFTCSNGHCIPLMYVCDGDNDCGDNSDEAILTCTLSCTPDQFKCQNTSLCLDMSLHCDGIPHCLDNSDEINCLSCQSGSTYCGNSTCIADSKRCDGVLDCFTGSDEADCDNCSLPEQFHCNNSKCIHEWQRCNGVDDCGDNSDEDLNNCTTSCLESQFQCSSGQCISLLLKCNGFPDCNDSSDEATDAAGCLVRNCSNDQFTCNNSQCISLHLLCDSQVDCDDGSDESFTCNTRSNNCECCDEENGGCDQLCNVTHNHTPYCACHEGYKLLSDGKTCTDIDECDIGGYCSQLCDNEVGSFQCSCVDGFTLAENGTCNALDEEPVLIGVSGTEIIQFEMSSNSINPIFISNRLVSSLNYDIGAGRLMWLEYDNDNIYSFNIQQSNTRIRAAKSALVTGLTSITTFTYNWITQSIIWSSETDRTVYITSLDGTQFSLLQLPDSLIPSSIAVDPFRQSVYLTTVNNGTLIKTSLWSQDHHSYTVLVPTLIEPSQMVIDFYSELLFFADVGVHAIMSVGYDGSDLKVVLGPQYVYMPKSLAVFEDKVFYCETGLQTVYWANKFGHSAPQVLETLSSSTLTIFHPLLQPLEDPYENTLLQPCKDNPCNKGLCLPVNDTSHRCICPEGYTINSTGACAKDVCSGSPCGAGLCLPNGTGGYYCDCPEGYESVNSLCNAIQSGDTGHSTNNVFSTVVIVALALILILTTLMAVIVLYRYYHYKLRHSRLQEKRLEDAQDDCRKSMSETDSSSFRISPDSTTHQLINTQL